MSERQPSEGITQWVEACYLDTALDRVTKNPLPEGGGYTFPLIPDCTPEHVALARIMSGEKPMDVYGWSEESRLRAESQLISLNDEALTA